MMGENSERQNNNENTGPIQVFFNIIWMVFTLPVGYILAALIIIISKRSSRGYWSDLKGKRGRALAVEWGDAVFIAFILAMFIRTFFVQAFKIPSGSMRPTLIERDRLIVNKIRYGPMINWPPRNFNKMFNTKEIFKPILRLPGFSKPKRGDVIVFVYPIDEDRDFIKRLIGFGGETIEIKEGDIYVDGKKIDDPIIEEKYYYNRGKYGKEGVSFKIPEGHYFVLGDNSGSSSDGRFWGFVPEENVIGRAEVIYWPIKRMRFIQ